VVLVATAPQLASQAAPKLLLQELTVRTWSKEQGLPADSVTAVLQTRDGYLWIGTSGGLARFDGVTFVPFAPAGPRSNVTLRVSALCEDSAGRLWIGTQGEGLLRYSGGEVTWFERNAELSDQTINSIAEDPTGNVWVGTPLGLNRLEGSRLTRFTVRDGLPSDFVSSVHVARSGMIWITTSAGMCQYGDGHVLPFQFEPDSAGRNPLYLGVYEDLQSNQWAYGDTYLVRIDKVLGPGKRLNYFRSGDTSSVRLWSLCEGRHGQLWIGTSGQELYCFADNKLLSLTLRTGRLTSDVRALFEDREGNLWLGTFGGGLVRLQPRAVRLLDASAGLPSGPAVCLAFNPEGRLWAGFEHGGLYVGNPERFEPATAEGELELHNLVSTLCITPDSVLWVGTPGAGLYCLKDQRILHYTTANGLSDNSILSLAAEPNGTVWAGAASGGLHRFANGTLTSFGLTTGLPAQPLSSLLAARGGGLWVGTADGEVLRGEGGSFRRLEEAAVLAGKAIRALYEDSGGRLWVGAADGGLACLSKGAARTWAASPGTATDSITGILGNEEGELWFATGRGIYHATCPEIDGWLTGQSPFRPELFFEAESPASSVAASGWPRAVTSPDGRLWFATASGVITFEPHGLEGGLAPPPVRIETVLANGQALTLPSTGQNAKAGPRPASVTDNPAPLRLRSDVRSLDVRFTAFCFAAPDQLRFRHKLEGSDPDWVDDGPQRHVRYERLPYGDYKFRVTACNAAAVWNETGAEFAFVIPTPAWRAAWALALYALTAVGLVAGGARLVSNRRLRRRLARLAQEQAMQRERMRIAQDMHDEIGSKLTKISFMSERAKGELEGQDEVAGKLDAIAHTSRDLLQSLDEIVWAVNPLNDNLEHLAAYLGQYATEYLQNTTVECELHIPRGLPHAPLSAETRHNLFLAFEEALNNALKHGRASRVRVAMAAGSARFEITVQDNGCGFDSGAAGGNTSNDGPRLKHGGNGLLNMRQRLTEVGGQCSVRSEPGHGATVTLCIPLNGTRERSL
jgi:signal transduction histidine kinase/ligand-binding sensor domain-containing protein